MNGNKVLNIISVIYSESVRVVSGRYYRDYLDHTLPRTPTDPRMAQGPMNPASAYDVAS